MYSSNFSENSRTLIGYLGEVFSVEFRLLKAKLCVIFHWRDNKCCSIIVVVVVLKQQLKDNYKQSPFNLVQNHCRPPLAKIKHKSSKVEVKFHLALP